MNFSLFINILKLQKYKTMKCVALLVGRVERRESCGPTAMVGDGRSQTGDLFFLDDNAIYINIHCGRGNLATRALGLHWHIPYLLYNIKAAGHLAEDSVILGQPAAEVG